MEPFAYPVSYSDDGTASKLFSDDLLHNPVGLAVDTARRLVKDQDLALPQHCPG